MDQDMRVMLVGVDKGEEGGRGGGVMTNNAQRMTSMVADPVKVVILSTRDDQCHWMNAASS